MSIEHVEIAKIRRDGGTQPRAALDEPTIAEYAEALQAGAEFPPVDVFFDGEQYWLADGFHRVAAHELAGRQFVLALIHQGDRRAAVLFSTGVNAEHGLRRTNADKRRAVEVLLRDPEWSQWSDREIARQCKVHHELVGKMRQELSGGTARYEPAGERLVTVKRGGTTYEMHVPTQTPATPDELQAAVRSWIEPAGKDGRLWVQQIALGNAVGLDHLERLIEHVRGQGLRATREDVRRAALVVHAELTAAQAKEVAASKEIPEFAYTPVWALEQAIVSYLKNYSSAATDENRVYLLEGLIDNRPGTEWQSNRLEDSLPKPYRPGDLQQALHNVLSQMKAGMYRTAIGVRSEEQVKADALKLFPKVLRWLKVADGVPREMLEQAKRMADSLLDVEGLHAARGRNYDWEALVGDIGAEVDHDALREAVRMARQQVMAQMVKAVPAGEQIAPMSHVETEPTGEEVIEQWLASLAEENEIPADGAGWPEWDAVRTVLQAIIADRANGGGRYWRSLLKHPAWPPGTDERAKLNAVRRYLERRFTGTKMEQQAVSTASAAVDVPMIDQRISRLVTAIDRALAYLKSLAAERKNDLELWDVTRILASARAEALRGDR